MPTERLEKVSFILSLGQLDGLAPPHSLHFPPAKSLDWLR
jgi:hypothetical protein